MKGDFMTGLGQAAARGARRIPTTQDAGQQRTLSRGNVLATAKSVESPTVRSPLIGSRESNPFPAKDTAASHAKRRQERLRRVGIALGLIAGRRTHSASQNQHPASYLSK